MPRSCSLPLLVPGRRFRDEWYSGALPIARRRALDSGARPLDAALWTGTDVPLLWRQATIATGLALLVALVAGCGKSPPMKVYPVSGEVLYRGQPAAGAELQLHGESPELQTAQAPYPKATVLEDGSFVVTSYEPGDGAPVGTYRVTIVWHRSDDPDPENREAAPDVLQGNYADPETSPLTVEVQAQSNQLPAIELE